MKIKAMLPAAKLALCRKWPYATTAIMSVQAIERPGIGTAAIDKHLRMYYCPKFITKLYETEGLEGVMGLLAHEVAHPMLRHHKRAERIRDVNNRSWQKLWNIAADLSVNSMLVAEGINPPEGSMFPELFGFENELAVEKYYSLLLDERERQQKEDGGKGSPDGTIPNLCDPQPSDGDPGDPGDSDAEGQPVPGGSGQDGVDRPWEEQTPDGSADEGLTEHEVEAVSRKCAEEAKSRGTKSAGMGRECEEVLEPKLDPRRLLMRAISKRLEAVSSGGGISSYRRPSRRPSIGGLMRPKTVCPSPRVVVIVDTSGSMNQRQLGECLGLIAKTLRVIGQAGVSVVAGDTKACAESKAFHPNQVGKIDLAGGGGTDMAAIMEDLAGRRQTPDLIICATDGGTPWPKDRLKVPTVVCLTDDSYLWQEPPDWLEVVRMN